MPVRTKMINPKTDGNEHLRETMDEVVERHVVRPAEEIVTDHRFVEAGKKKYKIVRKDPHGYWTVVQTGKEPLPVELQGKWTLPRDLEKKIAWYVNTQLNQESAVA